jgi:hypothetical protein
VLSIMEIPSLSQLLPITKIAIPQERCYISIQVTVFRVHQTHYAELSDQLCSCKSKETRDHILLHCPRYHRTRIKFFQALQLSPDDVALPPAATITRTLLYPKPPKKSLYNRWDTRIKMLNTDKDGKDINLKALKLVRRFIKDCGYLDRHCCPVNPFPC